MGEIGGNTWSVDNIIEGELVNERGELEEEGQRLGRGIVSVKLASFEISPDSHKPVQYRQKHQRQLLKHISTILVILGSHKWGLVWLGCSDIPALTILMFAFEVAR